MPRILLVTALGVEARPLMSHHGLSAVDVRGCRVFRGPRCWLIHSGMGKLPAAVSVAMLLAREPAIDAVINVGIGGGAAAIGEVFLAHAVEDVATGRTWYPHLPPLRSLPPVATALVATHDAPSDDYHEGTIVDMEAAGVWTAASRYLDSSRIHGVKVISDNPGSPVSTIDKHTIPQLTAGTLPLVDALIDWLEADADENSRDQAREQLLHELTTEIRHSVTQTHQLRRLLTRCQATGLVPLPDARDLIAAAGMTPAGSNPAARLSNHLISLIDAQELQY